jgi:uncharacterized protein (TIGR03663 family)
MQIEKPTERRGSGRPVGSLIFNLRSSPVGRWIIFSALALLALAVRLPRLGERPMHTDEAINGYITGDLLAGQSFHYDPRDRHGPALYLFAKPLALLCGAKSFSDLTETELRLTPVIIGSATILLFGAGVEIFGFSACLIAALMFAIAPLPVYYSRYFIHETLFVAFTLGLAFSGWRALKSSISAAAGVGLFAALLVNTKETFVIHFFALGLAAISWFVVSREKFPKFKVIAVALAVFIVAGILLFTWFGQNWQALADLFHAVPNLSARAAGEGHQKPFTYYFRLFTPAFILWPLALAGVGSAISDARVGARKAGVPLAIYALAVFLIYLSIPYKTPWLALNLWLPLTLLCGLGVEGIWRRLNKFGGRCIAAAIVSILLVFLGQRTWVLAFQGPADPKNPLAYAHTVDDLLRLPVRLEQFSKEHSLTQPLIAVVSADPWPLPWYLRKFQRVGFWQPGQDPGNADIYITSMEAAGKLEDKLKDRLPEFFGVRPEVIVILWPPQSSAP